MKKNKETEVNRVREHMVELMKLVIVRHISLLNKKRNLAITREYKLDDRLYLEHYAEFVHDKVCYAVGLFEKNKDKVGVEEPRLTFGMNKLYSTKPYYFLMGREGQKDGWDALTKSLYTNMIFEHISKKTNGKAGEYALTPEFMETFIDTVIRKEQLLNNREVKRMIKQNDIDEDLLCDVTSSGTDYEMSEEGKKMYNFMLNLSFIKDPSVHKNKWLEFYYVFVAVRDFVFQKKYIREFGKDKRIYTPFTSLPTGARVLFGLNCGGIKELRWIDGVSTYPSLLARLVNMYYPCSKSSKDFLALTTDREHDFYDRLIEIMNEEGMTKDISDTPNEICPPRTYTRKEIKRKFGTYLYGYHGDKDLDKVFCKRFRQVHDFVKWFRFPRKVGHTQIERNAKELEKHLEKREILSDFFPEVKELLRKYIDTQWTDDDEKRLQAEGDYDGKESRHPHAMFYLLEHLETTLFKEVLRQDSSGHVYMLHDSIGFPVREERKYYKMLCESAKKLGWKGFLVHLEYWDRENGTMVTDQNESRWPRALNLSKVLYNQRQYAKKRVMPKAIEESAGLIEEPIF